MSKKFDPLSMSKPSDKWVMSYVIQVELFSHYQSIIWPTPQILQLFSWSMSKQFDPLSMSKQSDKWVMSYVILGRTFQQLSKHHMAYSPNITTCFLVNE